MSSNLKCPFLCIYLHVMLMAAIAFGSTHAGVLLVIGFISENSMAVKLSALFMLIIFEAMQSLVFFVLSLVLCYLPVCLLNTILRRFSASKRLLISVITGALLGILFLPLCASVAFFALHESGDPSYLIRCAEFALPMICAGAFGGYMLSSIQYRENKDRGRGEPRNHKVAS